MIARKPRSLSFAEAASAPVVAVTAWQMLHDYAKAASGQSVLIHGAGGNVGCYAVQMARRAGLEIFATASAKDAPYLRSLGAKTVIDYRSQRFEDATPMVDIVLDMVGGEIRERSMRKVRAGGILVSVVSKPAAAQEGGDDIRTVFFLVEVTTERLDMLTGMFDRGELSARVGPVLPLGEARTAHEMLAGAPHQPGKIVLSTGNPD
jgi:NADPH:quinone reductase-like Zn-dependent oxidoreductase